MLQVIHSDEEWTGIIREQLIQHADNLVELHFCLDIFEWPGSYNEKIVFVEESLIPHLSNFDGKIVALTEGLCDSSDTKICAYSNPEEVAKQLLTIYRSSLGQDVINTEMPKVKSSYLVVGYANYEIAQFFSEIFVGMKKDDLGDVAILNLQLHAITISKQNAIPLSKLVLQPDDPIHVLDRGLNKSDFQIFYNSFHIEEFISLDTFTIMHITNKLFESYSSIIFVVDDTNISLQSAISPNVTSVINLTPDYISDDSRQSISSIQDHFRRLQHTNIITFQFSESWRKSLSGEVARWIATKPDQ